ncbi:dNA helicase II [Methanobrevibacter smithii CAG:186]|uniref:DNA 3'-5' helicase n=1 Tax=Methanobrevibacter smithii CAG:186 TaxID=1263088 RepID=R7PTA2_METSM|nr:ATP-dependent DNA helicase [Methanobrevibacter smithii]CDF28570.1 dNA helicase II [Methanobrevibacter smithii CAG:186]
MLNENQQKVVEYNGNKPLLVEAGPGSGKTRVIIERVKFLINELKVNPSSLLVITFTRKAANELKDRLSEDIPKNIINEMQISTIHSFCLDFLKKRGNVTNLIDDDSGEKRRLFIQKYKYKLGFKNEFYLADYQIPSVINKFDEYTTFKVDIDGLIDYIKQTRPIDKEYVGFVNSFKFFPSKKVRDNEKFKKSWYNARFLQTPKAYVKYLELLDLFNAVDYNTVQIKFLESLKENPETQYTNILVDEFQDTDPVQAEIFEILLKNAESFTAVGDVDQSIYSFRGSFRDYFEEFYNKYNAELISLNYNYRSTNNIIRTSEAFIKPQRKEYSKKYLVGARNEDKASYILESLDPQEEAQKIFNLIKDLKDNGKIRQYNDVAILYRSIVSNKNIPFLIDEFKKNDISYHISGTEDLIESDEVKSILTLFYYIARKLDHSYGMSNLEKEWLNLRAFCGIDFIPKFRKLSVETKRYLMELQENFENDVLKTEKEVYFELTGKKSRKKKFNGVFTRNEDVLIEIFKRVNKPVVDLDLIEDAGDREFFTELEKLRENVFSSDEEDKLTILEVYYELLNLCGYFDDLVINNGDYELELENLSKISRTIFNYESIISAKDVRGLFFFLTNVIEGYGTSSSDVDGVQLMTVHKAKGLEFPVTIVSSLSEYNFPLAPRDPMREKDNINKDDTFYTPNKFLEYKDCSEADEVNLGLAEENRVIYVAMTRAQDILVLSVVGKMPEEICRISNYFNKNLDLDNMSISSVGSKPEENKLNLSYSSFADYNNCPWRYNLLNKLHFKVSQKEVTKMGSIIHEALDVINQEIKDAGEISKENIEKIAKDTYYLHGGTDEEFDDYMDSIFDYYNEIGFDITVVDSEVPFSIDRDNYRFNGAIDLIYKNQNGEYGILDYKNTIFKDYNREKYAQQLLTYILALKNDSKYCDIEITEAKIYAIKSRSLIDFNIGESRLATQKEEIQNTVDLINSHEFNKNESSYCNICEFLKYCNG